MGCASSRADDTPLVALCRERRDLIRAAAERRYALAAAHDAYFRSLAGVGDALHRFAQEGFLLPPSSPLLPLPSSPKPKPRRPTAGGGSDSSITTISYSISTDGSSHNAHVHAADDPDSDPTQEKSRISGDGGGGEEASSSPPRRPSPNYYYMRSSTAIPSMVYDDPYSQGYSNPLYNGYAYDYTYSFNYPPYGVPIGSPPQSRDDPYYYGRPPVSSPPRERETPPPPPPPPPPGGSTLDFFNPFDNYEQFLPGFGNGGYGMASVISSPSSSEVREREGIPDLEEETESELEKNVKKEKVQSKGNLGQKDASVGSSKSIPVEEKTKKDDSVGSSEKESSSKSKGTEEGTSLVTEESGPSTDTSVSAKGSGERATVASQGTRDVFEAVKEIEEHFKNATKFGEEVARILEVGKLPYRTRSRIIRVIYSSILDPMALPMMASSRPAFKRSSHLSASTLKMYKAENKDFDKNSGTESHNLSSTLDKLYVWEKKLYKEVKDEEKLRLFYDKKCRLLKDLDDRGSETYKIDSTRASVRRLQTKISVALKSVDAISNKMHRLRDEELQPQLIKLIQGMIIMWKSMLDCHQKQLQAIVDSKNYNLVFKTGFYRISAAKATLELEQELRNWFACFNDWIGMQKDYVEALNGWLLKWLPQEEEVTPDGVVPFSPSRIGAPPVFIMSNDWNHAVERISVVDVTKALHSFTETVHRLWECQAEELRQQQRTESLSEDFARRFKSYEKENGIHGHLDVVSASENGKANNDDRMIALDSMKKRLDEEKAKHERTVKQVQEVASGSLKTGLVPIFEALENFTSQTLQAYEGFRISNEGGVT